MADSVLMKNRDYSEVEIAEDDPLMELSRIIGLEPRRDPPMRRDPVPVAVNHGPVFSPTHVDEAPVHSEKVVEQALLEETDIEFQPDFGDELQQDLADELSARLEADDEFSADLRDVVPTPHQDEASTRSLNIPDSSGAITPHVVMSQQEPVSANASSLEDELEAMLNPTPPHATSFGLRPVLEEYEAVEIEDVPLLSRATYDDFDARIVEPAAIQTGVADSRIDMNFDAEPLVDETEPVLEAPAWLRATPAPLTPVVDDIASDLSDHYEASEPYLEPEAGVEETPHYASFEDTHEISEKSAVSSTSAADRLFDHVVAIQEQEPVVETVIHESRAVDPTDEFDIPEFDYQDPNDLAAHESIQTSYDDEYEPVAYAAAPVVAASVAPIAAKIHQPAHQYDDADLDQINDAIADLETERQYGAQQVGRAIPVAAPMAAAPKQAERKEFVLDANDEFAATLDIPAATRMIQRQNSGRSYLLAAGLGALALLGGVGVYAWTWSPNVTTTAAPVVLKADVEPVKIAPESPGGKVVPNQDIAVYDKVAGAKPEAVAQKTLVSDTEQPVNLNEKALARVVLPGPSVTESDPQVAKAEDRVDPQASDDVSSVKTEVASVSPKKVRTMVVKSDGSLVERASEPAKVADEASAKTPNLVKPLAEVVVPATKVQTKPIAASDAAGAVAKVETPKPVAPKAVNVVPPADEVKVAALDPAPTKSETKIEKTAITDTLATEPAKPLVKTVKLKKITAKTIKAEPVTEVAAAANIPLVDARPAEQPVTIVAKTGKTPTAEPATAAGGNYVIQIASTPSPDAAQSTYASLSRKFGSVIGGRAMNVQQADIPGKGTFYRVRIAAGSKAEAAALCTKYKSAGGQCLVAR